MLSIVVQRNTGPHRMVRVRVRVRVNRTGPIYWTDHIGLHWMSGVVFHQTHLLYCSYFFNIDTTGWAKKTDLFDR